MSELLKHGYKIRCLRCCLNCNYVLVCSSFALECQVVKIRVDELGICNKFEWNPRFEKNQIIMKEVK